MPSCAVRYELEPLCQLPRPRFEAKVPFGDILSFLVRRLFVANFLVFLYGRLPCGSLRRGIMARVKKSRSPGCDEVWQTNDGQSFVGIFLAGISRLPIKRITMSDLENLDVQGLTLGLGLG